MTRLGHQRPSQTGFNVCLTRQPEWSVVCASLIAACPNCFTPSYIGWTFLSVSSINLGVIVHQCLQNKAPQYLVDYCKRTSDVSSCQRLRSANRYQLIVPRHRRSMFGRRATARSTDTTAAAATQHALWVVMSGSNPRRGKVHSCCSFS